MPPLSGFSNGFYEGRSRRHDSQTLENLYAEAQESGSAASPASLLGTPGLKKLATLPTFPLRGLWAGDNRCFAAAGDKLYEVFLRAGTVNTNGTAVRWVSGPVFDASMVNQYLSIGDLTYQVSAVNADSKQLTLYLSAGVQNGVRYDGECTFSLRGTIGDDDAHSPVRMFSNGNELFMASADYGYIATGARATGKVTTAGATVTYASGDQFTQAMVGQAITIDGVDYEVKTFTSATVIVLWTSAGTHGTAVSYTSWAVEQVQYANGEGTATTVGTAVTWVSGNKFTADQAGNPFWINGVKYIVASVTDSTHLVLTTTAGTQTAPTYSVGPSLTGVATGSAKTITWVSGGAFTSGMAGKIITLGGDDYTVDSVASVPTSITVLEDIATKLPVTYTLEITGTVDVLGTAVTWVSGDKFDNLTSSFTINGIPYQVLTWTDDQHVVLTADAGTQTGADYSAILSERNSIVTIAGTAVSWVSGDQFPPALAGRKFVAGDKTYTVVTRTSAIALVLDAVMEMVFTCPLPAQTGTCTTSGTAVTKVSGATAFTDALVGLEFTIGATVYEVASVTDGTHLVLTESAGTQTAPPYEATAPLRARQGAYVDKKFIAMIADTNEIRFSPTGEGATAWDPNDAGFKESAPDRLLAIWNDSGALLAMGYETGEIWRDTGTGAAAGFERDPSGTVQQGISAPWSIASLEKGPAWVGEDVRGRGVAWQMQGSRAVRISTHAVEAQWRRYSTTQDAQSYSYQEDGHTVWVVHFPSGNATWAYDETANVWAKRTAQYSNGAGKLSTVATAATWVSGAVFTSAMVGNLITIDGVDNWVSAYTDSHHVTLGLDAGTQTSVDYTAWIPGRQRQATHAFAFQRHLVGDWATGAIYEQNLEFLDDDGDPILRERTCPHVEQEQVSVFYHRLQLEMEVGGGGSAYTDLFIDSGVSKNVTSVLTPFTNLDIGRYLNITSGTGFTVQRVRIVAVNGQGVATASKALGTLGSSGGHATVDDPQMWLELSRNGGKTYGPIHATGAGRSGDDSRRALWNRLGSARDRVFRLRSTARVQHAWLAADLLDTLGNS